MKWIDVKDKRPELNSSIIAFDKIEGVVPCTYCKNGFGKSCYWYWNSDIYELRKVMYWMSLPDKPKIKKDKWKKK